jgi:hypothetical protein
MRLNYSAGAACQPYQSSAMPPYGTRVLGQPLQGKSTMNGATNITYVYLGGLGQCLRCRHGTTGCPVR